MEEQLVIFKMAGESYGVDIGRVQSITQMQEITHVPRASEHVEGVINLRGVVMPVIDLRKRFGLPALGEGEEGVIVIVELAEQQVGLVVDKVTDVERVSEELIEPPSPLVSSAETAYLRGIGRWGEDNEKLVLMLDIDSMFTLEEQEALKEAA